MSSTVTVPAGATSAAVTVTVTGDTLFEADETFSVTLSAPGNATLGVATGVATITNDDAAPAISVNDAGVVEGNTGSQNAVFTVSLSAASGLGASATFVTANATATAGSDYTAVSTTVTIPAGATAATVNVPVLGDTLAEATETFTVALSGPVGRHGRRPRRRRHDHRQRPAGAEHLGRDDCRGQQRLVGRHLHRLAVPERGGCR